LGDQFKKLHEILFYTKEVVMRPSERFVLIHRLFTFFDEWLFYGLLLYLYVNEHYGMVVLTSVVGAVLVGYAYVRGWRLEDKLLAEPTDE